jgi:hypothetical protein
MKCVLASVFCFLNAEGHFSGIYPNGPPVVRSDIGDFLSFPKGQGARQALGIGCIKEQDKDPKAEDFIFHVSKDKIRVFLI